MRSKTDEVQDKMRLKTDEVQDGRGSRRVSLANVHVRVHLSKFCEIFLC